MKKKEMIDTIINAFRTYELKLIVPTTEKDTIQDIALKTELIFNSIKKDELKKMYKAAKSRIKYNDIGLIS